MKDKTPVEYIQNGMHVSHVTRIINRLIADVEELKNNKCNCTTRHKAIKPVKPIYKLLVWGTIFVICLLFWWWILGLIL